MLLVLEMMRKRRDEGAREENLMGVKGDEEDRRKLLKEQLGFFDTFAYQIVCVHLQITEDHKTHSYII